MNDSGIAQAIGILFAQADARIAVAYHTAQQGGRAPLVAVFGAAQPHCAYLFANRLANRMKVLVHDRLGIWLAARRLHQG